MQKWHSISRSGFDSCTSWKFVFLFLLFPLFNLIETLYTVVTSVSMWGTGLFSRKNVFLQILLAFVLKLINFQVRTHLAYRLRGRRCSLRARVWGPVGPYFFLVYEIEFFFGKNWIVGLSLVCSSFVTPSFFKLSCLITDFPCALSNFHFCCNCSSF